MSKFIKLLTTLIGTFVVFVVEANEGIINSIRMKWPKAKLVINPFDLNNKEDVVVKTFAEISPSLFSNALTAAYGTTLILNPLGCTRQFRCLTTFQASGYDYMATAIGVLKGNFRYAAFEAIQSVPDFFLIRRSFKKMDDRVIVLRRLLNDILKAKDEGVVTKKESCRLLRDRQREIRNIKRDMQRIARAKINIGKVVRALDLNEVTLIARSFLLQLLAALSGNIAHGNTLRGSFIANLSLFKNLGGLVQNVHEKLYFPSSISFPPQALPVSSIRRNYGSTLVVSEGEDLKSTKNFIIFGISGYLVLNKNSFARKINNSILSASVVLRGFKGVVEALIDKDSDANSGVWATLKYSLEGRIGGLIMIALSVASFMNNHSDNKKIDNQNGKSDKEREKMKEEPEIVPKWIKLMHDRIENAIENTAVILDHVLA